MNSRGPLPPTGDGEQAPAPRDPVKVKRPKGMPKAAAETWDWLTRHLAIAGRLKAEDLVALEKFCRTWALYRKVLAAIEKRPAVKMLSNGVLGIDPHYKALKELQAEVERGVRHFGLSPAARGSIGGRPGDAEDREFDDFLANRPEAKPPA